MTVKIITEWKFKEDPFPEGLRAVNEFKVKAMQQKGYISGETLVDLEDNQKVVVLFVWSNLDGWNAWANSLERSKLENELIPHLEEPVSIRAFVLGADGMANACKTFFHDSAIAL